MKHVMIFGTFDYFHPGHQFVVRQALERGKVIVVVAQDATVKHIKGLEPTHSITERMAAISSMFADVEVIAGSADKDFLAPIRAKKPDLLLLGYDQNLPPGISYSDLPPVERLPAFKPEEWKSSKLRVG